MSPDPLSTLAHHSSTEYPTFSEQGSFRAAGFEPTFPAYSQHVPGGLRTPRQVSTSVLDL